MEPTENRTFAKSIGIAMAIAEMTPIELVAKLEQNGVSVNPITVARWLDGTNCPRSEFVPAIARVLSTDPNTLLGFEHVATSDDDTNIPGVLASGEE